MPKTSKPTKRKKGKVPKSTWSKTTTESPGAVQMTYELKPTPDIEERVSQVEKELTCQKLGHEWDISIRVHSWTIDGKPLSTPFGLSRKCARCELEGGARLYSLRAASRRFKKFLKGLKP